MVSRPSKKQNSKFQGFIAAIFEERGRRIILVAVIVLLLIVAAFQTLFGSFKTDNVYHESPNRLILGKESGVVDSLRVPIMRTVTLDDSNIQSVRDLRYKVISTTSGLAAASYYPSKDVYGNVDWSLPWLSDRDLFLYGKRRDKLVDDKNRYAASSTTIANPLLLVHTYFWGLSVWDRKKRIHWARKRLQEKQVAERGFPLYPKPQDLIFEPRQRKASITYDVTNFLYEQRRALYSSHPPPETDIEIGLSMQNARDFNLNYVYLFPEKLVNISSPGFPSAPVLNTDRYEWIMLAWMQGRTFNFENAPVEGYRALNLQKLPAHLELGLWADVPPDVKTPPDLTFSIEIK